MKKLLLSLLCLGAMSLSASAVTVVTEDLAPTTFTNSADNAYTATRTYSSEKSGISYKLGSYINGSNFQQNKAKGCFFEVTANNKNAKITKIELIEISKDASSFFTAKASDTALPVTVKTAGSGTGSISGGTDVTCSYDKTNKICTFEPDNTYFSYFVKSSGPTSFTFSAVKVYYEAADDNRKSVELVWNPENSTINLGEELVAPTLTAYVDGVENVDAKAVVKYTSDNEGLLTIAADGTMTIIPNVIGSATITASIPSDNESYVCAEPAKYTLTVVDPNATEATFVFAEMGYTNQQVISTITGGIVTLSLDKGSNNNDPKYFTSSKDVRVYGGGTFSISVPEGFVIKQIISTFKTGTNNGLLCDDDGTLSTDNTEWTALSDLSTVTFKVSGTSGNCGWTKLVVKYEKAGDPSKADAGLKYDPTNYELTFGDAFTAPDLVNPNGLTVIYESNKPEVAEVDANTGAVTIKAPGVATITAKSEATDKYNAGSASYTLDIAAVASSIAQFETFGKNDSNLEIQVNFPMTVGFVNNQNLYLTDGVNWIQIYIKNSYNVGDVIPAGWTGQYTLYNDVTPQIKVVGTLPASTETAEVNYRKVSSFTENDVNEVLILTNAVLETASPSAQENFPVTVDGTSFTIRNNYKLPSVEPGVYDIKCVVNIYKPQNSEAQLQAYAIEFTPVVTEAPVMKVDGVEMSDFTGMQPINEDALISFEAANGETIWYRLSKVEATVNALAENADGFTLYENPFKVGDNNTLEFYAESAAGVKSEIKTLKFSVITGIEGVEVDAVNGVVEYFNLQGVKVEAPANGLYIRRQGTKVEKVIVK